MGEGLRMNFDQDAFEERAAIIEFDGGLTRFEAETLAAEAQGLTRWQAMEAINAKRIGNSTPARDQRAAAGGHTADDMSRVQFSAAEEVGPVSERDIQGGRDRLALLALPAQRG